MKLWLVIPCFFDADSFQELKARALSAVKKRLPGLTPHFVVVDDSGGQDSHLHRMGSASDTTILVSQYNLGHQDAIVFSLRTIAAHVDPQDFIVTLDCDGEDLPEHIPMLIEALAQTENDLYTIALARRTKRNESLLFKLFYLLFKHLFLALTGLTIKSGNFAAFRGVFARNALFHPFFDYCYSSSLIALPFKRVFVPLARGTRYYGRSKMRFLSLIGHGLRMLLPFTDRIAVRLAITCAFAGIAFTASYVAMTTLTCLFAYHFSQPAWTLTIIAIGTAAVGGLYSLLLFAMFFLNRATSMRHSPVLSLVFEMGHPTEAAPANEAFIRLPIGALPVSARKAG